MLDATYGHGLRTSPPGRRPRRCCGRRGSNAAVLINAGGDHRRRTGPHRGWNRATNDHVKPARPRSYHRPGHVRAGPADPGGTTHTLAGQAPPDAAHLHPRRPRALRSVRTTHAGPVQPRRRLLPVPLPTGVRPDQYHRAPRNASTCAKTGSSTCSTPKRGYPRNVG